MRQLLKKKEWVDAAIVLTGNLPVWFTLSSLAHRCTRRCHVAYNYAYAENVRLRVMGIRRVRIIGPHPYVQSRSRHPEYVWAANMLLLGRFAPVHLKLGNDARRRTWTECQAIVPRQIP